MTAIAKRFRMYPEDSAPNATPHAIEIHKIVGSDSEHICIQVRTVYGDNIIETFNLSEDQSRELAQFLA